MIKQHAIVTNYLQSAADTTKTDHQKQQYNLYNHLSHLLNELPRFETHNDQGLSKKDPLQPEKGPLQPEIDPLQQLERISEYYKKNQLHREQPLDEKQLKLAVSKQIEYPDWLQKQQKLLQKTANTGRQSQNIIIQNYQSQQQGLFRKVGLSLGEEESVRITYALKKLAYKQNAINLRFWGKILTRSGDYFVIEGHAKKEIAPKVTGDQEKYREGSNYNSYWVSHQSIGQEWYELPLVTPEQIRTSRLIKYLFTGHLERQIVSYPVFKGQEKHLLKAQLVRITHNCEIVPKGMYAPLEENADQVDFAEDFKMPEFGQLTNLQNWAHLNPYILNLGRANYYVDPKLSEEQKQQAMTKLAEKDPKIERLKGINEDKPVQKMSFEGCWIARVNGSTQVFNNIGKEQGTTSCYGVVTLRNPNWPGWITAANSRLFSSIYIGYGVKLTQPSFDPIGPDDLLEQGEDGDEFGEPNPANPPDQLEPDSDDDGKKPEQ